MNNLNSNLNFVFFKDTLESNGDPSFSTTGPIFYYIQTYNYSYTLNGELRKDYKNILLIEPVHKLKSILDIPDTIYNFVNDNNIKLLIASIADPTDGESFQISLDYITKKLPISKFEIIDVNTRLNDSVYSIDWFLEEAVSNHITNFQNEENDLGYISEEIQLNEIDCFRNKKFLCFNKSIDKEHRISLLHEYIHNDYSDSYFSFLLKTEGFARIFNKNTENDNPYILVDKTNIDFYNKVIPIQLDTNQIKNKDNLNNFRTANTNKKELFLNSCIHIVTETVFAFDELFISEKIVKPIINYQPFIVLSSYGYLERLKKYGFKTFSEFWDESYDQTKDPVERFFKILQIIRELNSKTVEELNEIYQKCKNICIFNKEVFHSLETNTMDIIFKNISLNYKN